MHPGPELQSVYYENMITDNLLTNQCMITHSLNLLMDSRGFVNYVGFVANNIKDEAM